MMSRLGETGVVWPLSCSSPDTTLLFTLPGKTPYTYLPWCVKLQYRGQSMDKRDTNWRENVLNWVVKSVVCMSGAQGTLLCINQYCGGAEAAKHWQKPEKSGLWIRNFVSLTKLKCTFNFKTAMQRISAHFCIPVYLHNKNGLLWCLINDNRHSVSGHKILLFHYHHSLTLGCTLVPM